MKFPLDIRPIAAALIMALPVALIISSCGYGVRPEPRLRSVKLGAMDNRTHEPALNDTLRLALTRELLARGVKVNQNSGNEISGSMDRLDIKTLAERAGVAIKFSVTIFGRFSLRMEDGAKRELDIPLNYIVAFGSDVPLDDLYALREEAIKRAVHDLASDIATGAAFGR